MSDDGRGPHAGGAPALVLHVDAFVRRIEAILDVFERRDGELWRTLESIAERPHRVLVRDTRVCAPDGVRVAEPHSVVDTLLEPGAIALAGQRAPHFVAAGQRWRFLRVVTEEERHDADTPPNRVAAHFVRKLVHELRKSVRRIARATRTTDDTGVPIVDPSVVDDAEYLKRRLLGVLDRSEALRQASSLDALPTNNLVLRHDSRYRLVLEAYVELYA